VNTILQLVLPLDPSTAYLDLFHLNTALIVALVVSPVIPLLSSLLARAHWPGEVVGILTLVLAAANGFFSEWAQDGDAFDWRTALSTAVGSFIVAIASRYGLWKGTTTDAKLLQFPGPRPPEWGGPPEDSKAA
jgi:hypothetical protein